MLRPLPRDNANDRGRARVRESERARERESERERETRMAACTHISFSIFYRITHICK